MSKVGNVNAKKLACNLSTEEAFSKFKLAFTMNPILKHPDPEDPFKVEANASETGVGGILSQCIKEPKNYILWPSFHGNCLLQKRIMTLEIEKD